MNKSPLEDAMAELSRVTWTGVNIVGLNEDWLPNGMSAEQMKQYSETCPIWPHYKRLLDASCKVKQEWQKTSQKAKDILFTAAIS